MKTAALVGFTFGTVFWIVTIPWIAYTIHRFGEVPRVLAVLGLLVVAVVYAVPFALMTATVAWATAARPTSGLLHVLVWPAAWVVQESFRTHVWICGGFPWALLAYPLASVPPLTQSAALGGVVLTSALVVAMNVLVFSAVAEKDLNPRLAWIVAALVLFGAAFAGGRVAMEGADARLETAWTSVGIVQTNVEQELRWTPEARKKIYDDLKADTRRLVGLSKQRPDLVLWPESASPYSWSWSDGYRDDVVALCKELDVGILLSTAWTDEPSRDDAPFYNAALLVTKDGPVLPPYFKVRLVPFGEYVPLQGLLSKIKPISRAVPSSFSPGPAPRCIPWKGHLLGGAVCYEVVYPWILRKEAKQGADLLFTLTNDSWYGAMGAQRQHWQAAVFRAVETRTPLVRAAVTGISGFVESSGRSYPLGDRAQRTEFTVPISASRGHAPAVAAGEAVPLICAVVLVAAILRARFSKPRRAVAA